MAQRRRSSTVNAPSNARQRATTRDTRRAGHTCIRAVISRWLRRPEGRPPSEGRQAGREGRRVRGLRRREIHGQPRGAVIHLDEEASVLPSSSPGRSDTVDDSVVRESLRVPPTSTGLHNSLNRHEFEKGQKRRDSKMAGICLGSRGSQVRVLPGALFLARFRRFRPWSTDSGHLPARSRPVSL